MNKKKRRTALISDEDFNGHLVGQIDIMKEYLGDKKSKGMPPTMVMVLTDKDNPGRYKLIAATIAIKDFEKRKLEAVATIATKLALERPGQWPQSVFLQSSCILPDGILAGAEGLICAGMTVDQRHNMGLYSVTKNKLGYIVDIQEYSYVPHKEGVKNSGSYGVDMLGEFYRAYASALMEKLGVQPGDEINFVDTQGKVKPE
jgi:hypothetical protein